MAVPLASSKVLLSQSFVDCNLVLLQQHSDGQQPYYTDNLHQISVVVPNETASGRIIGPRGFNIKQLNSRQGITSVWVDNHCCPIKVRVRGTDLGAVQEVARLVKGIISKSVWDSDGVARAITFTVLDCPPLVQAVFEKAPAAAVKQNFKRLPAPCCYQEAAYQPDFYILRVCMPSQNGHNSSSVLQQTLAPGGSSVFPSLTDETDPLAQLFQSKATTLDIHASGQEAPQQAAHAIHVGFNDNTLHGVVASLLQQTCLQVDLATSSNTPVQCKVCIRFGKVFAKHLRAPTLCPGQLVCVQQMSRYIVGEDLKLQSSIHGLSQQQTSQAQSYLIHTGWAVEERCKSIAVVVLDLLTACQYTLKLRPQGQLLAVAKSYIDKRRHGCIYVLRPGTNTVDFRLLVESRKPQARLPRALLNYLQQCWNARSPQDHLGGDVFPLLDSERFFIDSSRHKATWMYTHQTGQTRLKVVRVQTSTTQGLAEAGYEMILSSQQLKELWASGIGLPHPCCADVASESHRLLKLAQELAKVMDADGSDV